ncbi:MAG TPA: tetratricopeptide repeat protein [Burkholderiales bacterium]|nr:tetratricopeptide repeat protein [Burkholderiales bacterium]
MSVINRMLQELDRRGGTPEAAAASVSSEVRPVRKPERHEWFWRALAVLMLASVAWTGWVAYELMWPRELVTPLAFQAAEKARSRHGQLAPKPAPVKPAPVPPPVATAPAPAPPPAEVKPAPVAEPKPAPVAEAKLPPRPEPAKKAPATAASATPRLPPTTLLALDVPPARVLPHQARKVERQNREAAPGDAAERDFRRAVDFLKRGRAAEAEKVFATALQNDPLHRGARQALIALELERGGLERAQRLLEQGLELDRAQPDFALTLARIHMERKDYAAAIGVLDRSLESASGLAEYHYLRATVLQRLERHGDAAKAFRASLETQAGSPKAWIGLGISLEALKQRPEAADAFQRALAAGPANDDLRTFAEQRLRALR